MLTVKKNETTRQTETIERIQQRL